ncbi:MAG: PHP domain-containing protein [Anaerolineae bacterium]|nr:PHP domain-containing protein [Anaerolineae bacterium]
MLPDKRDGFRCELHMHTVYSDGYRPPEFMLGAAVAKGLSVVAFTDHDTAAGVRAAAALAPHLGLDLIPAIEFTSRWDDVCGPESAQDVDVLGYFVDLDSPVLKQREAAALEDIHARVADCCTRLTEAGYPVLFAEVRGENPRYAGLRQLRDLLVKRGYRDSEAEAAALLDQHWPQVRLCRFSLHEQIATIHAAGGVAILAHPDHIQCSGGLIGAPQVEALVAMGLDGIEVYHRTTPAPARVHFAALAAQFGLLVTGGSDEHGWTADLCYMGQEPVTEAMVAALWARHLERANGHA